MKFHKELAHEMQIIVKCTKFDLTVPRRGFVECLICQTFLWTGLQSPALQDILKKPSKLSNNSLASQ